MRYDETVTLKDGTELHMRNGVESDARAVYENVRRTHSETDYLLSYPDEQIRDIDHESLLLKKAEESDNEIEIIALTDEEIVGTASVKAVGSNYKVRHRAECGISVLRKHWGSGIGRALMSACIDCARRAGYAQLELEVVADNVRAISMYKNAGFEEYGRNPQGYNSRSTGFQELVYMRLEL